MPWPKGQMVVCKYKGCFTTELKAPHHRKSRRPFWRHWCVSYKRGLTIFLGMAHISTSWRWSKKCHWNFFRIVAMLLSNKHSRMWPSENAYRTSRIGSFSVLKGVRTWSPSSRITKFVNCCILMCSDMYKRNFIWSVASKLANFPEAQCLGKPWFLTSLELWLSLKIWGRSLFGNISCTFY